MLSRVALASLPKARLFALAVLLCVGFAAFAPGCTYFFDLTGMGCNNDLDCPNLRCLPAKVCGSGINIGNERPSNNDAGVKEDSPEKAAESSPEKAADVTPETPIETTVEPPNDSSNLPGLGQTCTTACRDGLACGRFPGPKASSTRVCLLACNTSNDCTSYCANNPLCVNYKGTPQCNNVKNGVFQGQSLCYWTGCTDNRACFDNWICELNTAGNSYICLP
ncbi:MAG: hypothetical protein EP343_14990 [Deltaproteobacteria bacterium]|nr:MAG: hypothetical protein EP343_14990 [Deltaproteobacteria bacterium]